VKQNKCGWWKIAVPIVLVLVILAGGLWLVGSRVVAPKAVLTSALTKVFTQLDARFRGDPLWILAKTVDAEGKYTADIKLETEQDLLGHVVYDMTVQTDGRSHRILASGNAATGTSAMDLSLYLDDKFMAVSSEDLVKGNYYGITYDTFTSDLQKIPLLRMMVSDSLLEQWNSGVQNIQKQMSRTYAMPQIPELSAEDLHKLLLGIAAMPSEKGRESLLLGDTAVDCQRLDFRLSGKEVDALLAAFTDGAYREDAVVTVSFYLYQETLVRLMLHCEEGASTLDYSLHLGMDPGSELLTFQGIENRDGDYTEFLLGVTTEQTEDRYAETWNIHRSSGKWDGTSGEESKTESLSFEWAPDTGHMVLKPNGVDKPIVLNFSETENGFRLETDEFTQLMRAVVRNTEPAGAEKKASCSMTVTKGSDITVPAYRNLDQWSMEDFLLLLGGIGSLIGIRIQ